MLYFADKNFEVSAHQGDDEQTYEQLRAHSSGIGDSGIELNMTAEIFTNSTT